MRYTAADAHAYSIAVGDVNGDGIPDIIIGAWGYFANGNGYTGSTFVVFGQQCGGLNASPCSASYTIDTTLLNGTTGTEFDGAGEYGAGFSVAVGDVNGDGIADIIISAPGASPNNVTQAGSVYVVYGHSGSWGASSPGGGGYLTGTILNSTFLNGTNGVELDGVRTGGCSARQ